MKEKQNLIQLIEKHRLCISENPYGIERSWPKSYVKNFYNHFCYKLYQNERSPNILEINQSNFLNIKLWEIFFENPNIDYFSFEKLINYNFKNSTKYDLIIINYINTKINFKTLKKLIFLLKRNGVIVIENIGRKKSTIIKIFYYLFQKYNLQIRDYRLKSFILNNCLLIISKNDNKFLQKIKNLSYLFFFILFEDLLSFLILIKKK